MSQWSELPQELLVLIANLLTTRINILRFRSVCRSWRSAVTPPSPLKVLFPIIPDHDRRLFPLTESNIYLLEPVEPRLTCCSGGGVSKGWLVKVEEGRPKEFRLLYPLSRIQIVSPQPTFPPLLDSSAFRITELGKEYVIRYPWPFSTCTAEFWNLFIKKAILSSSFSNPSSIEAKNDDEYGDSVVATVILVSGKLGFFKSGDEGWTVLEDQRHQYEDVMNYNRQLCAVDRRGRLIVIDHHSLKVTVIASRLADSGNKKQLVESFGELFLVDRYIEGRSHHREVISYYEHHPVAMEHARANIKDRFMVYKLDGSER